MVASAVITDHHIEEVRRWFSHLRHLPEVVPVDPDNEGPWLEARRTGLGGSDMAAILGHSSRIGPLGIYLDKIGMALEDEDEDPAMVEAAHFGHILEDVVAQEFAARTGLEVRKAGVMFRHPVHKWMNASPDRLVFVKDSHYRRTMCGGLEIKTRSAFVAAQWADGLVPPEVYDQVQQYIEVLGLDLYYLAALIGGQAMIKSDACPGGVIIRRDQDRIDQIVESGDRFWNKNVVPRIPPDADGTEGTTNAVRAAFRQTDGTSIALPSDMGAQLIVYKALTAEISRLEKEKKAIANLVKMQLGEAETGYVGSRLAVAWRQTRDGWELDGEAMQARDPKLWDRYAQRKPGHRTFRVLLDAEGEL